MIQAATILAQILELLQPLSPSDRLWIHRQIKAYMSGSSPGSKPVQIRFNEPVHEPVQNGSNEPVHERSRASFERFWSVYPRKQSKKEAFRVFSKVVLDSTLLEVIIASVQKQKNSVQWREEPRFIPLAKTWLNQERWNDEPFGSLQMNHHVQGHSQLCQCIQCHPEVDV